MKTNCLKTSNKWLKNENTMKLPHDEAFYELSATNADIKKVVNFERFERYVNIVEEVD